MNTVQNELTLLTVSGCTVSGYGISNHNPNKYGVTVSKARKILGIHSNSTHDADLLNEIECATLLTDLFFDLKQKGLLEQKIQN